MATIELVSRADWLIITLLVGILGIFIIHVCITDLLCIRAVKSSLAVTDGGQSLQG